MRSHPRLAIALVVTLLAAGARAELPPLIPRDALFGSGLRAYPTISPDGKRMAWLARGERGVINVWVQTIGKDDARAVTREHHRPVYHYEWAKDGKHILYFQDGDGDENTHLFSAEIDGQNVRDLTAFRGVRAANLMMSAERPNEVLIALNVRDRRFFDIYRANLETGALRMEAQNPGDVISWVADPQLAVRAATAFDLKTARTYVKVRDAVDAPWRELIGWDFDRAPVWYGQVDGGTMVLNFTPDGKALHVMSAAKTDTLEVLRIDVASGRILARLAHDPRSDVAEEGLGKPLFIENPRTRALEAVAYEYFDRKWHFVEPSMKEAMERLERELGGFVVITSRDTNDTKWIVHASRSDRPPVYYLYDRAAKSLGKLFAVRPELDGAPLVAKEPIVIRARDGVELPSYITFPAGVPRRNLPLIAMTHGGPWQRDNADYDSWVQFLANRGYAVLQVNFRGSSGFGAKFVNAFTGEMAGKAVDDVADGIRWAVAHGYADPKRLGAFGQSGGGYTSLMLMSRYPELVRAGAAVVAPMDLRELVAKFPVYWGPSRVRWLRRVGNVLEDDELNRRVSPLHHAGSIKGPLLVVEGAHDPRESRVDEFIATIRKENKDVTLVVYPDEGHGLARPENQLDFFARLEHFFARHLGGRAEEMKPIAGATAEVR